MSARDGSGADVKFNSERHDRDSTRTGERLRMELEEIKSHLRVSPGLHVVERRSRRGAPALARSSTLAPVVLTARSAEAVIALAEDQG